MARTILLADALSLGDLVTYLGRAGRVEDGSVRLIAGNRVLAVYTAILYPAGLLDESQTVLGLRTLALEDDARFDVVVPVRSLLDRLTRAQEAAGPIGPAPAITVPTEVSTVTWAGISPPRGGWQQTGEITAGALETAGRQGIEEVANALPEGTGEQIVRRVRTEIWGRPVDGMDAVPAGAGFAALTLGFLGEPGERIPVYEAGAWTRLSSARGHVLVRRRSWSLLG
ncbi:hypothetical protein [Naasia sp. SYSU D00057]|uniref:hypothetical protein n=1 Tax=Naasia sp. SYSU D00057 TaxID=2817380 RepID=UPI001B309D1E|nr:hypothetical protein [Naasia sp. SYSU D00057]